MHNKQAMHKDESPSSWEAAKSKRIVTGLINKGWEEVLRRRVSPDLGVKQTMDILTHTRLCLYFQELFFLNADGILALLICVLDYCTNGMSCPSFNLLLVNSLLRHPRNKLCLESLENPVVWKGSFWLVGFVGFDGINVEDDSVTIGHHVCRCKPG